MQCNKNIQWILPFYHDAKPLLGKHKLDGIYGYKVPIGKAPTQDGQIIRHEVDGRVTKTVITLRTHWNKKRVGRKDIHVPITIASVLQTFAHELAHLKYWEHDIHQWALCAQIQLAFSKTFENLGWTDTEDRPPHEDE